jgi:GH24 family phage-related lysozyme (muramidase)
MARSRTSRSSGRIPPSPQAAPHPPPGLAEAAAGFAGAPAAAGARTLSAAARELIVRHESGGRAFYEQVIKARPHWPAFSSGLTIGFGWDLGFHTRAELEQVWGPRLGAPAVGRLAAALGLRAVEPERARKVRELKEFVRRLADIVIPWEMAEAAFLETTAPAELARTLRALPAAADLPEDCLGALVSLVFNRGAGGFTDPRERFTEMRAIRAHLLEGRPERIPAELRAMARLWPDSPGLQKRRAEEAELFERGLRARPAGLPGPVGAAAAPAAAAPLPVLDAAPDRVDLRDLVYRAPLVPLPPRHPAERDIALHLERYREDGMILDQGREGACTGFGLAACINFLAWRRWVAAGRPSAERPARVSPKMLYELAKLYDEWPGEAYEGSSCRGAMKGWHKHGACAEPLWPATGRPDPGWTLDAAERPLGAYYRVDRTSLSDLQAAIHEVGAVYASANVHRGWRLGATAELPEIPWRSRTPVEGGHAFALVGYERRGFIVQNSWGPGWGFAGFAILGYDDWLANGMDAWVAVTGAPIARAVANATAASSTRPLQLRMGLAGAGRPTQPDDERWDEARARRHTIVLGNDGRPLRRHADSLGPAEEVEMIGRRLAAASLDGLGSRKLALYAHGGLNSEEDAIARARVLGPCFLRNGIHPLFVAWKTSVPETLRAEIEDIGRAVLEGLGIRAGGKLLDRFRETLAEIRDRSIEAVASAGIARAVWTEMKENAAGSVAPDGGMAQAAAALAGLAADRPGLEVHLIGHSAGAILLGHLIRPLRAAGLRPAGLHLFAPACTMRFAADSFGAALAGRGRALDRRTVRIWLLSDRNERADSVGPYGKSLLYLVSRALERDQRTPLLGLAAAWDPSLSEERDPVRVDDPGRLAWLEAWGDGPPPELLREPEASAGPTTIAADHGSFDNNVAVIAATLRAIRGAELAAPVTDLRGF